MFDFINKLQGKPTKKERLAQEAILEKEQQEQVKREQKAREEKIDKNIEISLDTQKTNKEIQQALLKLAQENHD